MPVSVAGVSVVYKNVTDPELFYGIGPDLCLVDSRMNEADTESLKVPTLGSLSKSMRE